MPSEGHLYAAAAPSLTTAISVAVAAGESLLTAAVLAIAGIYMTRSGFMGQEVTRGLAALQMRCLMPCLLFSRVLPAVSPRLLVLNWPMLLLPLAMVPIGLALGKLVALLSGSLVRPQDHWIVVCATAFPNSISLPTVLLTVVQEILYRGGAAVPPDGLVADPLVFVGFYQPVHMTLLWALGGWLLGVNMEQTPEEAAPPRPARGGGGASAASTTASSRTGSLIELSVLEADARASPPPPASAHALFRESLFSGPEGGYPLRRQKDGGSYAKYLYSLAQGDAEGNHAHVQLFARRATGGGATSAAPGAASGAALLAEHPAAASDAAAWGSEDAHDNDALGPIDEAPRRRYRRAATACAVLMRRVLVPPVVGVLLGAAGGSTPWLRPLMYPPEGAPFGWLWRGVVRLGQAAIPVSLLLLGVSLAKGPDWSTIDVRANLLIALTRLVATPLMGTLVLMGLRASGALEPISPPWDEVFILVALVLCAMPSGQQLITMTELGGGDRAVLGTIIFLQYCLVPIALAATITAIVLMTAML